MQYFVSSSKISQEEKSRIAARLLIHKSDIPETFKLEKPKFPNITENTELVDLVTPSSFKFFSILGLDSTWLEISPDKWEEDNDYITARNFLRTVKVTNDVAERGVKMATDFA